MRIAEVIGTVTLSRVHPSLTGLRWLVVVPFSLEGLDGTGPADGEDLSFTITSAPAWAIGSVSARAARRLRLSPGEEAGRCLLCLYTGSN